MAKDDLGFEGLTQFQQDLLEVAQNKMPKESRKIMAKVGNKAATEIRKVARADVIPDTGTYQSRFKRGKVFKDEDGQWVTRVYNSAPHAHLIEYGHRQVTRDGREVGFTLGFRVMDKGSKKFDDTGTFERMLSDWLDDLLDRGDL